MTEQLLVDAHGNAVASTPRSNLCPSCGAGSKDREMVTGFGGYFTDLCQRCGHVFGEGRK